MVRYCEIRHKVSEEASCRTFTLMFMYRRHEPVIYKILVMRTSKLTAFLLHNFTEVETSALMDWPKKVRGGLNTQSSLSVKQMEGISERIILNPRARQSTRGKRKLRDVYENKVCVAAEPQAKYNEEKLLR